MLFYGGLISITMSFFLRFYAPNEKVFMAKVEVAFHFQVTRTS